MPLLVHRRLIRGAVWCACLTGGWGDRVSRSMLHLSKSASACSHWQAIHKYRRRACPCRSAATSTSTLSPRHETYCRHAVEEGPRPRTSNNTERRDGRRRGLLPDARQPGEGTRRNRFVSPARRRGVVSASSRVEKCWRRGLRYEGCKMRRRGGGRNGGVNEAEAGELGQNC